MPAYFDPLGETLFRGGALLAYALSGVLYAQLLVPDRGRGFARLAARSAVIGLALQTALIALMWSRLGRPPLGNLSEALLLLSWTEVATFVLLLVGFREPVLGAFMMPLGLVLYAVGVMGPEAVVPADTHFFNPLFQVHVTAFLVAYAAFGVAFCGGVMYLLLARDIRRKQLTQFFLRLPSLEALDSIGQRAVWVGFPLLIVGLATGIAWGQHGTHAWGLGQAKVLSAFVTLVIYLYYLVRRVVFRWSGRHCAIVAVIGYVLSLALLLAGSFAGRLGGHL